MCSDTVFLYTVLHIVNVMYTFLYTVMINFFVALFICAHFHWS